MRSTESEGELNWGESFWVSPSVLCHEREAETKWKLPQHLLIPQHQEWPAPQPWQVRSHQHVSGCGAQGRVYPGTHDMQPLWGIECGTHSTWETVCPVPRGTACNTPPPRPPTCSWSAPQMPLKFWSCRTNHRGCSAHLPELPYFQELQISLFDEN